MPSGSWGYLSLGERLRPEDQPRELLSEHPQLVFRADFVELVDHADQGGYGPGSAQGVARGSGLAPNEWWQNGDGWS